MLILNIVTLLFILGDIPGQGQTLTLTREQALEDFNW
jgi:hypothetical protein